MARHLRIVLVLGAMLTWATPAQSAERYMCVGARGTFEATTYDKANQKWVCDEYNEYKAVEMKKFYTECYDRFTAQWAGKTSDCGQEPKKFTSNYQTSYERYLAQGSESQCVLSDKTTVKTGYSRNQCKKAQGKFTSAEEVGDKKVAEHRIASMKAKATPTPSGTPEEKKSAAITKGGESADEIEKKIEEKKIQDGQASIENRKNIKKTAEIKKKELETSENNLSKSKTQLNIDKADLQKERDTLYDMEYSIESGTGPAPTEKQLEEQRKAVAQLEDKISEDRQAVKDDRKDRREAKKGAREAANDEKESLEVENIKNEGDGKYGGKYGGASVATSGAVNAASMQVSGASDMVGQHKVNMASQDREAALRQEGNANLNIEKINEARQEVAKEAKKSLNTGGVIDMVLGLYQGVRATQHLQSMKDVEETAKIAKNEIESEKANKTSDQKILEAQAANVNKNSAAETEAQGQAAIAQGMAAAAMMYKGVTKFQEAAAISAIEAQANANAHQYGFGMGGGITQGGGQDGVNALSPVQSAVTTEEEGKKEDLAQNSNINPNDPNLVPEGPPAAAFQNQDPSAGGGGGGGGLGAAGGTSADRGAMEAGGQGPAAVTKAGSYAAVAGGGGYKSKNAGGAGKTGVDTGFADLLKKFLPGAEPEKKKAAGELQFGDRSPASSQTAVIGRNKNIFEEISKRYQKKTAEGSVF